ncbi:hypothetical protein BJV78DRAFT_1150209 [Lactifluus subvellereus]|nr:hypothetical protein BJV78DRAFT_1150209 [Lactifluus subvellereus]
MSDDTLRIKRKLSALTSSLDDLETGLSTLLSQSLPEVVLDLETIQQAKLQVVVPYLVYDLVFVYLKTRGLDPKTHPVIAELDRVRQYFDKIKDAEDPAKRQLAIDRVAATRFIKHAIAQAKDAPLNNGSGPVRAPVKVTEKMLEREQYFEALREEDALAGEEEELEGGGLEVIEGEEPDGRLSDDASPRPCQASESELEAGDRGKGKGKGKAKAVDVPITSAPDAPPSDIKIPGKRRRPATDPFAGYGDDPDARFPALAAPGAKGVSAEASSGTNTPPGGEQRDRAKKSRKRPKKKGYP